MAAEFKVLLRPELQAQLRTLEAEELEALRTGLRALAEGREHEYGGERLGHSPSTFDLRDCAQLKLGPHLLIYREFDDRPGTREAVCFQRDRRDQPFVVAAQRLGRMIVRPDPGLITFPNEFNAAWNPAPATGAVTHTPHAPTASTFRNPTHSAPGRQR